MRSPKILSFAPVAGLLFLIIIYFVIMQNLNSYMLSIVLNQTVITAIVSTGAIFIFTLGAFDISLGASVATSAIVGALVYNMTNSLPIMLLTCIAVAVFVGAFNSILSTILNLPAFVTTIAMLSILNALISVLIESQGGTTITAVGSDIATFDTVPVKLTFLILFVGACTIIFNYTKIGRKQKFIGGNPVCAELTGISKNRMTILAFIIAGIGVGISAFLTIVRSPTLSTTTASSVGMDVIIAIVFGGMPLSGGANSKIFSALIGSLSMVLLSQILITLGLDSGSSQMVKSILFIVVVFLASLGYRKKLLPR